MNAAIKRHGFSDLLQSPVYVPRREETYFFYPVRHEDRFNAVVNFFDGKREGAPRFICSLDGPTLFGIGELAAIVARKNSNEVSRQTLLPRAKIRMDGKRLNKSYDRPNIYSTDAGIVEVIYKTTGKGKGLVTVEAKNGRGMVLAGGDYELAYSDKEPRGPKT